MWSTSIFRLIIAAVWLVWPLWGAAANGLKDHPSPYLALHGEDPVAWRDWGDAALAEARATGRPLFVSSGYFACHWCHVMQRESFRDPAIAELLNTHFIPVKLDRELNPALDDHLIRFTQRTSGQGGWPLNVFLTPDGYPVIGMTYLPPKDFRTVLARVAGQWREQEDRISALARRLMEQYLADKGQSSAAPLPSAKAVAEALRRGAFALADELGGGFGQQNKFPMEPQLLALLAVQESDGDERLGDFLKLTLDQMAARGLRDHLAGGFFRYTVDPDWRTPHYEKMLYNQALLARVYMAGARIFQDTDYAQVAGDTLDFVLRDMAGTEGGYIASLSAVDVSGNEGGSYLWDRETLEHLLEEKELALAVTYWSLNPAASPAEGLLPQRLEAPDEVATRLEVSRTWVDQTLPTVREKLLVQRATRLPPRDTKQLAAWNALLLKALVEGAQVLGHDRYRTAAASLAGYLVTLWDGQKLLRARDGIRVMGEAALEDYAYVADALQAWAAHTSDDQTLALARAIATAAWKRFFDESGWRLSASANLPGMGGEPALSTSALPAPSAVLMRTTPGLGIAQADAMDSARRLSVAAVADEAFWYPGHALTLWNEALKR